MHDGELLLKAVIRAKGKDQVANRALADYLLDHVPERRGQFRVPTWFRTRGGNVTLSRAIIAGSPYVRVECRRELPRHAYVIRSVFKVTDADAWQVLTCCFLVFRN